MERYGSTITLPQMLYMQFSKHAEGWSKSRVVIRMIENFARDYRLSEAAHYALAYRPKPGGAVGLVGVNMRRELWNHIVEISKLEKVRPTWLIYGVVALSVSEAAPVQELPYTRGVAYMPYLRSFTDRDHSVVISRVGMKVDDILKTPEVATEALRAAIVRRAGKIDAGIEYLEGDIALRICRAAKRLMMPPETLLAVLHDKAREELEIHEVDDDQ